MEIFKKDTIYDFMGKRFAFFGKYSYHCNTRYL